MKTPLKYKIALISLMTMASCSRVSFLNEDLGSGIIDDKIFKLSGTVESLDGVTIAKLAQAQKGAAPAAAAAAAPLAAAPAAVQPVQMASKVTSAKATSLENDLKLATGNIVVCDVSNPLAPKLLQSETVILTEAEKAPEGSLILLQGMKIATERAVQDSGAAKRQLLDPMARLRASDDPAIAQYTYSMNVKQQNPSGKNLYVAFKLESTSKVLNDVVSCPQLVEDVLEFNDDLGSLMKLSDHELTIGEANLNLDLERSLSSRIILSL